MTSPSTLRPARYPKSLSPIVRQFAEEMQQRLDASGRHGYQHLPFSTLMERVERNAAELRAALTDRGAGHDAVVTACAVDVANYAMFIAINNIFKES